MTYNKWKFLAILCIKHKCLNFKNCKSIWWVYSKRTGACQLHFIISRLTNTILEYNAFYLFWHTFETTILKSSDDSLVCNSKYRISCPVRRTFFPKNVTKIQHASYAPRVSIISKLINTCTFIIHLYRKIVKFASKSWDLASLLMNGLFSYPGIYPNIYIASRDSGIYAAAVAKCS